GQVLADGWCNASLPHGETELLRRRPRDADQRQLALPVLTDPPLLGKLLHVAGALSARIGPRQGGPGIQREQQREHDRHGGDKQLVRPREREIHERKLTSYLSVLYGTNPRFL